MSILRFYPTSQRIHIWWSDRWYGATRINAIAKKIEWEGVCQRRTVSGWRKRCSCIDAVLQTKLKEELDGLVKSKFITPVAEPTEW